MLKQERDKFKIQLLWAIIGGAVGLVLLIVALTEGFEWEVVGGGLILIYLLFSFMFMVVDDDSVVHNLFIGALSKTVEMPGVIFSLDLSSVAFMLVYRFIIAPLLTFIIGLIISILGFLLAALISMFIFPFSLGRRLIELKDETKREEEAKIREQENSY